MLTTNHTLVGPTTILIHVFGRPTNKILFLENMSYAINEESHLDIILGQVILYPMLLQLNSSLGLHILRFILTVENQE